MLTMHEAVTGLKTVTDEMDAKKSRLDELKAEFQAQNETLIKEVGELFSKVQDLKSVISELAIDEFKASGSKKLFGGIGIRETTRISYDEKEAFGFAREKDMFLSLDKKAFEKAAESLGLDFVKIEKVPQATFPKEIVIENVAQEA